jgi:hypothetical protein
MNPTEQKTELLSCPFCGGEPAFEPDRDGIRSDGSGIVECRNINCPIGCLEAPVSVTAWNTRHPAARPDDGKVDRLRRTVDWLLDEYIERLRGNGYARSFIDDLPQVKSARQALADMEAK